MPRHGGDRRGSAEDRRRRKTWMLWHFGDGESCQCVHCNKRLTRETLEADRIIPGGGYGRKNIQPSCRACNLMRADDPTWKLFGGAA